MNLEGILSISGKPGLFKMVSQAQNILNLDLSNQFSFNDFESSSKDWVLTFLNKTIIVDEKVKIIDGFSNLFTNDIEEILNSN